MKMTDRDISDVSGYTYTYLMNGENPATGFKALFKNGENDNIALLVFVVIGYTTVSVKLTQFPILVYIPFAAANDNEAPELSTDTKVPSW